MTAIRPLAETADTVTLARADYEALRQRADDARDVDVLDAAAAEERRLGKEVYRADFLPVELVERLLTEHPLRVWRDHRGLTGKQLAEVSGVPQSYISEIETRRKPGSFEAMVKLARALGIGVDDLVDGADE